MKTLREVLKSFNDAAEKDPSLLELPVVFADAQCAHYEVSGYVFSETVEDWPSEYCIADDLGDVTEFVRLS